ncbi:MAG TPA: HAMP domain-containing protein, partial [Thermoanaerobaculia bacterium]
MTTIGLDKGSDLAPRDFERLLLRTLTAVKKGDFTARMPVEFTGTQGKIADTLNDIIEANERLCSEIERISTVVGKEGKLNQRMTAPLNNGAWAGTAESVNSLVTDLVAPTNEIARVIGAVAKGDLTRTMAIEFDGRPLKGEFLRTAKTVNTMVDQLSSFASEVTRVAREVGTEGRLGVQAVVPGVAGT